jgi:hypothetical protein
MIQFEITNSPDDSVKNQYQFFQNTIYIGRKSGNLQIQDNQLLESHLMIEVLDNDLIIHPQKDVTNYLIDGKRSSSIRKLKKGQTITIGTTTMKILQFEYSELKSKKKVLDDKLAQLVDNNSPRVQVIEILAKLMK